jgi:ATP-dependent DNA ligase
MDGFDVPPFLQDFVAQHATTRPLQLITFASTPDRMNFEFCLPTTGKAVPTGPDRFHEIKYDGYRLRIEREATPCG